MRIEASRPARRHILDKGGKVYVWFTPVKIGADYLKQRVSTTKPRKIAFERFDADRFALFFDAKREPPDVLTVRLVWPCWLRVGGTGVGEVSFADGGDGG